MNTFDVAIIGAGVAGAFASLKLSKEHKDINTIVLELGRPPIKRRRQLEGWLGCLPNSDGKFYISDLTKVESLLGAKKTKNCYAQFNKILKNIDNFKIVTDKTPSASLDKKVRKLGFDIHTNDFIQVYSKQIHALSKHIANECEKNQNFDFKFDEFGEVTKIHKEKDVFVIVTTEKEFRAKKVVLAVGRSGWRWAKDVFSDFGIIENNDYAKFGVRIEMSAQLLKDFNKSNCTFTREDLEIGPFSWNGTVIPEDHLDIAISSFRSNENRWKTDKVSFNVIGNRHFQNGGFEQTDRLSKLTFVLANDRIIKEKVNLIMNKKSKISIIPEYDWLIPTMNEINSFIPELLTKAYFHVPTITPLAPKINIGTNLETEVEGLFVVGETAGISGLLAAATSGLAVVDGICK